MNLADLLLAPPCSDRIAMVAGAAALSHAALRVRVERVARALISCEFKKGDRIGVLAENGFFFAEAYLGSICAGLVAVPLQTDATADLLSTIHRDVAMRAVLVSERLKSRVGLWLEQLSLRMITETELPTLTIRPGVVFPSIDDTRDLAALMFTSGSTRAPKGVMVSHHNVASNTRDIVSSLGLCCDDRAMVVLPFYHCFGLSLLHTHLMVGGAIVVSNQLLYPEKVLDEMKSSACTGFAGVPFTYRVLLRQSSFKARTWPALRWMQHAGGRLQPAVAKEVLEVCPHVQFYSMYGQTEATARLSCLSPEHLADKVGSVGKGLPATRLDVVAEDGTVVAPGSGAVGEVVATGANVTLGYWNDLEETAKYFRQGRLHTGDLATIDADGFIFLQDRDRDMIKSAGVRISALEVEAVISEMPTVVDVAVVGRPDDTLGEAVVAFVLPARGASITADEIQHYCHHRLPPSNWPTAIEIRTDLPYTSTGKVLKRRLKEACASLH